MSDYRNAKPTCRLGTAANWLKSEVVVPPSSFSGLPVETGPVGRLE